MPGCNGGGAGAQDAELPHAAHRSRTGPLTPVALLRFARRNQAVPNANHARPVVGRGGPLIVGGSIGRLSSFLAASGWRLGRGA